MFSPLRLAARFALGMLLLCATSAFAQPVSKHQPFYLGAGGAFVDIDSSACNVVTCDREAGFDLMVGYQMNRFAGFEWGYFEADGVATASVPQGRTGEWSVSAGYLAMIGRLPIRTSPLAVTGRIGVHAWQSEGAGCAIVPDLNGRCHPFENDDGFDLLYGIGLDADLTNRLRLQTTWTNYETESGQFDLDVISTGLLLTF